MKDTKSLFQNENQLNRMRRIGQQEKICTHELLLRTRQALTEAGIQKSFVDETAGTVLFFLKLQDGKENQFEVSYQILLQPGVLKAHIIQQLSSCGKQNGMETLRWFCSRQNIKFSTEKQNYLYGMADESCILQSWVSIYDKNMRQLIMAIRDMNSIAQQNYSVIQSIAAGNPPSAVKESITNEYQQYQLEWKTARELVTEK